MSKNPETTYRSLDVRCCGTCRYGDPRWAEEREIWCVQDDAPEDFCPTSNGICDFFDFG